MKTSGAHVLPVPSLLRPEGAAEEKHLLRRRQRAEDEAVDVPQGTQAQEEAEVHRAAVRIHDVCWGRKALSSCDILEHVDSLPVLREGFS